MKRARLDGENNQHSGVFQQSQTDHFAGVDEADEET